MSRLLSVRTSAGEGRAHLSLPRSNADAVALLSHTLRDVAFHHPEHGVVVVIRVQG